MFKLEMINSSEKQLYLNTAMLSACSGLLLTAAFPAVGWSYTAWIALVFLLWAVRDLSVKQSFAAGFAAGLVHYLTLLYWLVHTMHTYGYLPIWLSALVLCLLAVYLALYPAVFAALVVWLRPGPIWALILFPSLWVCLEFARNYLLTGFPWGLIGYSQYRHLSLIQMADIFGVYGVSFLIVLANAVVFFGLVYAKKALWRNALVSGPKVLASFGILAAVLSAVLIYGGLRMDAVDEVIAGSETEMVAVVQGNVSQSEKWDAAFCHSTIDTYLKLSGDMAEAGADLIIWPETAAPFYFRYDKPMTAKVVSGIKNIGVPFIVGAPTVTLEDESVRYYNSAYMIAPDGAIEGRYDKAHLVPFGEYVPLKRLLFFIGPMVAQVGEFGAGPMGHTLTWDDVAIGVQICYEAIFPELAVATVRNRAALLVNITNDAWFGFTSAPYQHFSMAVFRAVENRRSLARAANTGISGFIDPVGRILVQTPLFEEAAIVRPVPVIETLETVYTRYGALPVAACFVVIGIFIMLKSVQRTKKEL
jgi:apolipoprotein N-acyltransferase